MDASGGPGAVETAARAVGLPATELAARVQSGELSAVDVVRAHLAHIEAVDARVGAFRVLRTEAALREAAEVDDRPDRSSLPLAGVPIAIKDNVDVAGEVNSDGVLGAVDRPPCTEDHPVVARLRAAGAVVVGITRVPELCLYGATDCAGSVTRSPWDTARSAAGSSGGSAAAVASGGVPLAQGNDGMGSLRLPAAACGLVTLKPGRGVVPARIGKNDWNGMAENGALATTVADLALAHAVLAGEPPGPLPEPGRPLRVAVSTRSPLQGVRADAETLAAVDRTVATLVAAGHTVVRRDLVVPTTAGATAIALWLVGADDDAEHVGVHLAELEPRVRTHARLGRLVRRAGLARPGPREKFRARATAFFDDVDALLTPITAGPSLPARPWHERSWMANITANMRWAPWGAPWNLVGFPAMSVPAGVRADGLPAAVQLAGPPGAEKRLLWLAGELERRQPWRRYAPVFDPTAISAPAPV
jgi:amidase